MRKKFAAYLLVLLGVCLSGYAAAQDASGIMNMFSGMLRAAIIDHARTEWSKVTPNETSCIEQGLQQQGYSIDILVQQGIAPQDPRVSGIRSSCRVSSVSLPSASESERKNGHCPYRLPRPSGCESGLGPYLCVLGTVFLSR